MQADGDRRGAAPERLRDHPDFVLFAASRLGAVAASQVLTVAVGWLIYVRTGSTLQLGLVGLARFLPSLLLFLPAGIVADLVDRRRIMAAGNAVQAAAALALGAVLAAPGLGTWPVFLLLGLHGAAQAFLQPAQQAALPNLVPQSLWSRAVAAASAILKVGQLGGPALAGLLLATIGPATVFVAAAGSAVAALGSAALRTSLAVRAPEPFSLGMLFGGMRYILATPVVLGSISIDLVAVLFGSVMGLLPVYAADILHVGPEALGLMRAAPAVGGLAMGLLLARVPAPEGVGRLFFLSLAVFGLSILVFAFSTSLWLSLAALAVYGGSDMFSVYVRQTLVQLNTPDALRGRVNAVNAVSINASNELGDFRAGAMAAVTGAVPAVALGALVTLGATALWLRLFPALRGIDRL